MITLASACWRGGVPEKEIDFWGALQLLLKEKMLFKLLLYRNRGCAYCLGFRDAEIDTEDINQQPQQHVLSTTFRSPTSRAARKIK